MKLLHIAAAILLLGGCTTQPPSDESVAGGEPADVSLTAADSAAAVERGAAVATAVAQGLAQRLQAQLKQAGAAGAVDFCSTAALALTDSLAADEQERVTVKRTSTRIRNPRNEPDSLERRALAWFDSVHAATGEIPQSFVQAAATEVRFYRPLVIAPFCVQCHGPREQLDAQVTRILDERYPADRATGYQAGDLRGVIRVSLERSSD
jgi:hypothetical protein